MKNLLLAFASLLLAQNAFACTAGFSYVLAPQGNNLLNVNFTNNCTPLTPPWGETILYIYRFGDGDTLATAYFSNPNASHNYASPGTYTATIIIEIVDSPGMTTIYCADSTTIPVTVSYEPCATSFSVSYGSAFSATFTASNPAATSGMSYSWAFGDGNTGTGSPITHTYSGPGANNGNYYVTLTATSSLPCSYTNNESILFSNQISGLLKFDSLICTSVPSPTYKVWLITYAASTQMLTAIDSLTIPCLNNYGNFIFYNEPTGIYRVKAIVTNGPTSGTGPLPTYSQNSLHWNTADSFVCSGTTISGNNDIDLQIGTVTSGPGFISGNVTMGANKSTKTTGGPSNIEILLSDGVNGNIAYAMTDANGDFSFSNLPVVSGGSTYTLYPEVLGYNNIPWDVTLYPGADSSSNVTFHISTNSHTAGNPAGIENISKIENDIYVYPNPSTGSLSISSTVSAPLVISDVVGHRVFESRVNAGNTKLDLANLGAGMYFISIKAAGINYSDKLLIQH